MAPHEPASREVEIGPFRETDLEGVVALWRTVFPDAPPHNDPVADIGRKARVQPELFLVARCEGELVGTCMAGYDGHRGWIHLLAVAPALRRRGIGAALVGRAEALLAERGCPKLNLQVRASSPESLGFYERLGFAVEERVSLGKRLPPAGHRA